MLIKDFAYDPGIVEKSLDRLTRHDATFTKKDLNAVRSRLDDMQQQELMEQIVAVGQGVIGQDHIQGRGQAGEVTGFGIYALPIRIVNIVLPCQASRAMTRLTSTLNPSGCDRGARRSPPDVADAARNQ